MIHISVENFNTLIDKIIDREILCKKKTTIQFRIWRMFKNVNEKKFKRIDATKIQRQHTYN